MRGTSPIQSEVWCRKSLWFHTSWLEHIQWRDMKPLSYYIILWSLFHIIWYYLLIDQSNLDSEWLDLAGDTYSYFTEIGVVTHTKPLVDVFFTADSPFPVSETLFMSTLNLLSSLNKGGSWWSFKRLRMQNSLRVYSGSGSTAQCYLCTTLATCETYTGGPQVMTDPPCHNPVLYICRKSSPTCCRISR